MAQGRGTFRAFQRVLSYPGAIVSELPLAERYLERIGPDLGEIRGIHLIKRHDGRTQIYGIDDGMGFSPADLRTLAQELLDLAGPIPD